jgi:quercetin dioxygenase-like cupin family protein
MAETHERSLDLRSVFGLHATITKSAAATSGAFVEMDCTAYPGARTIIHYHPEQEETYRVIEGTLDVFRDGRWGPVRAGESATIPRAAVHGFRNATEVPVRFINVHRPALGFQKHLETLDRLVRAGKIRSVKDPRSLIYMAMSAVKHRPDVPVQPPYWLLKGMAFAGRRLGFTLDE